MSPVILEKAANEGGAIYNASAHDQRSLLSNVFICNEFLTGLLITKSNFANE